MSRRRVAIPQDEKSISYSVEEEIASLKEEVRLLKRAQGILLISGHSPTLDGYQLARCRCGKFATRQFSITHPMAGLHHQCVCEGCKVEHPIAANQLSIIEAVPYATQKVIGLARDLNSQIEEMFK